MPSNALKIPFARALNQTATNKALNAIQVLGKALPCSVVAVSGSIVTVAFQVQSNFTIPNVTMPMFGPEYIRYPTQVGDLGVAFPADVRLGSITGLGGGIPDLSLPANLSALVFFPVASTNWSATDNANAVVIYGPDGVILKDTAKTATVTISPNAITLTATNIILNGITTINGPLYQGLGAGGGGASLLGPLNVTNDVTAGHGGSDQVGLQTHTHPTAALGSPSSPTPGT